MKNGKTKLASELIYLQNLKKKIEEMLSILWITIDILLK